jgi:hypothetical protein
MLSRLPILLIADGFSTAFTMTGFSLLTLLRGGVLMAVSHGFPFSDDGNLWGNKDFPLEQLLLRAFGIAFPIRKSHTPSPSHPFFIGSPFELLSNRPYVVSKVFSLFQNGKSP